MVVTMVDFHTHIIFDVDDGSKSLEESIIMLLEAKEAGFTDIILTPHYIEGYYENDFESTKPKIQELKTKLYDLEQQKLNSEQASERRGMIGSGDRSERVRTYNFPQNRITDHRINLTLYKLEAYLDGDLYEMIDAMLLAEQTQKLQEIEG